MSRDQPVAGPPGPGRPGIMRHAITAHCQHGLDTQPIPAGPVAAWPIREAPDSGSEVYVGPSNPAFIVPARNAPIWARVRSGQGGRRRESHDGPAFGGAVTSTQFPRVDPQVTTEAHSASVSARLPAVRVRAVRMHIANAMCIIGRRKYSYSSIRAAGIDGGPPVFRKSGP